jgi:hypothetical protein
METEMENEELIVKRILSRIDTDCKHGFITKEKAEAIKANIPSLVERQAERRRQMEANPDNVRGGTIFTKGFGRDLDWLAITTYVIFVSVIAGVMYAS